MNVTLNQQYDTLSRLKVQGNILSRIRNVEYETRAQYNRNFEGGETAEVFDSLGAMDFLAIDDAGLLRVVVSARDLYDVVNPVTETAFGVHAHILAQNTSGVPQFYVSADDGHAYMINAEVSGTMAIGTGSMAGGWFIDATQIFNDSITLDSALPAIKLGAATDYLSGAGVFMGKSSGTYKMHVGNPLGGYFAWNGTTPSVSGNWITGSGLNASLQSWRTTIVFSTTSATAVSWTSGSITLNDGTSYSISSGSKTGIAALTYLYLDTAVSLTALQNTTSSSTAVGSGKILIAAVQNNTTSASILPYGGQQPIIDGGAQIAALSILAGNLAAGSVTASKISVTDLSAVNTNTGSLTVSGTLSMPGSSAAIAMGSTPPTGAASGTGAWIDRNVISQVKSSKQTLAISATDGSTKFGSDLSAAATTSLVIAGAALTYNGESLSAGSVLFGDNSSGKASMQWDPSAGQLKFRGGTTVSIYIDTDGSLAAGSNTKLNASGLSLLSKASYTTGAAVKFYDDASPTSLLIKMYSDYIVDGDGRKVRLQLINDGTSAGTDINLTASGGTGTLLNRINLTADRVNINTFCAWMPIIKTADETINNDNTLNNDSHLTIPLAASTKYHIRGRIYFDTGATEDFKFRFQHTGSATLMRSVVQYIVPGTATLVSSVENAFPTTTVSVTGTGTTGGYIDFDFVVHNSTAGSFIFQWCQNTSGGTNTTVRAASIMEYCYL